MSLSVPVPEIVESSDDPLLQKPVHWDRVRLGDIADILNGYAFSSEHFNRDGEGLPLVRIRDVGSDTTDANYAGEYDQRYIVEPGDLLIGMDGDFKSARWRGPRALLNQRVCKVTLTSEAYEPRFLDLVLPGYLDAIHRHTSSVTVKHLSSKSVANIPLPFPPLVEQKRLADKIEELFSKLDVGLNGLQTAKRQLERYRLSVLQAAVEGRLTAGWRRKHSPAESADELVSRAEEQDEVNKYKSRDKLVSLSDPPPFQIPNNWQWVRVGDIARRIRYGTSDKADREYGGIPVLRMGNIEGGRLQYENLKFMPEDWEDEEKFLLEDGDVLFNRTNSAKLVGKTAVYKESHPTAVFASYLVRVRLYEDVCNPDLLVYYINSVHGRVYIREVTSQQVGQANVNATKLASMPFPLPPIAEQRQIAEEVERLLSIADDAVATSDSEMRRASKLRQSILRDAFNGKLLEKPT